MVDQQSSSDIELQKLALEREKLTLECEKLKLDREALELERIKTRWNSRTVLVTLFGIFLTVAFGLYEQYQKARSDFGLKAAEILMNTKSPFETSDKAEALVRLFPDWLPQDFAIEFNRWVKTVAMEVDAQPYSAPLDSPAKSTRESVTPNSRLSRALTRLAAARSERDRFHPLNDAATQSMILGHVDDARRYATELLNLAPQFHEDWNYGNAIQDGNLVLGRIAVREGRMDEAKQYLGKAGESPGSPQMDTFGPNMSLAKDLLEKGDRQIVLEYFDACRKFWKKDNGRLDRWARDVRAGNIPDFGPNLVY